MAKRSVGKRYGGAAKKGGRVSTSKTEAANYGQGRASRKAPIKTGKGK